MITSNADIAVWFETLAFGFNISSSLLQSVLDLVISLVFLLFILFNKPNDVMDNSGILGFLECMFWKSQFFFWTFSVASTYNIVTMTIERSVFLLLLIT